MRPALPWLLLLVLVLPSAEGHDVGSPAYVNQLFPDFETPDLAPGESGPFRFNVTNPYPWTMQNIRLRLEVYRYREIDADLPVNGTWNHPGPSFFDPFGIDHGLAYEPPVPPIVSGGPPVDVAFTVVTYPETPHGSLTKQGSYFVRTLLDFELFDGATTNRSLMMSLGHFTDAEFEAARLPLGAACPPGDYCTGLLDMTVLANTSAVQAWDPGRDHLDGLLPDTAFSVKDRMPLWPFVLVGGVMVASLGFSILFYAEENPGKFPRLARWWLGVKGKARTARTPRSK